MTAMARPNPRNSADENDSAVEDDPLVELARIVSGRSSLDDAKPRNPLRDEPGLTEADLARDLEVELLSDLQASFAAAGDVDDDAPPFYAEDEIPEEPVQEASFEDYQGPADDPEDEFEAFDGDGYYEEPAPEQPPEAVEDRSAAFGDFGLRDDRGGPAFNPSALSTAQGAPPAEPTREPATGWEATVDEEMALEPAPTGIGRPDWDDADADEPPVDAAYQDSLDASHAFGEAAAEPPAVPAPAVIRHRDRRLDTDPHGAGARHAARRRNSGRYYTVFGVLALVAIGTAAVLVLRGGDAAGEPPLIVADTGPTRVFPDETPAAEPAGNAVINRIDPDATPADENLLAGPEPVVDVTAAPEANDGITQLLGPATPEAALPAADNTIRTVRTVTVEPDGTIVANNATPANGETPAAEGTPAVEPTPAADPAPAAEPPPPAAENPAPPAAATPEPVPVADATPTPTPATPPALAPETPAVPPVAAIPNAGDPIAPGLYVQVAALGTEALAQSTLRDFRNRAPAILADTPAVIQRAEVNAGVYYRVWFGPFTSGEAESLRRSLAGVGIESFIQTNN